MASGVEEHEHRQRVIQDGVQPQVGQQEGQHAEGRRPYPVGRPAGEDAHKGLAAAGDEPHRGFQAGHRDGDGQDHRARAAKVPGGDLGQRLAAVGGRRKLPAALGAPPR